MPKSTVIWDQLHEVGIIRINAYKRLVISVATREYVRYIYISKQQFEYVRDSWKYVKGSISIPLMMLDPDDLKTPIYPVTDLMKLLEEAVKKAVELQVGDTPEEMKVFLPEIVKLSHDQANAMMLRKANKEHMPEYMQEFHKDYYVPESRYFLKGEPVKEPNKNKDEEVTEI